MANVSKIKLPDNSTLDIIDSRISSVDSSISSSSSGVVTNSTIAAEFDKVAYIGDTIDSVTYTDSGIVIDVSNKADKVTNATSGNFAALDANGNLTDSGHKSSDYQTTLISGTNIKTINNESLLGSGNITISAGGSGTVTSVGMTVPTGLSVSGSPITSNGTLAVSLASGYEIPQSNAIVHKAGTETITGDKTFVGVQTFDDCVVNLDSGSELNNLTATDFSWLTTNDGSGSYKTLQSELNNKQNTLVSGTNIKTVNNQSLLGSGNLNLSGTKVYEYSVTSFDSASITSALPNNFYLTLKDDIDNGLVPIIKLISTSNDEIALVFDMYYGSQKHLVFSSADKYYVCTLLVEYNKGSYNKYTYSEIQPQERLVSGTNIKTINNTSLLGSGNISIPDIPTKIYEIHPVTFNYNGIYAALPSGFYNIVLSDIENGKLPILRVGIPNEDSILDLYFSGYSEYQEQMIFSGKAYPARYCFFFCIDGDPSNGGFKIDTWQSQLVSGTNIKTINNQSLLGSGNITISGGGGDTSSCVHITGDESVGGDKTFTDNIAVVDASHILYSGASPSQGFTRGYATFDNEESDVDTLCFNVQGEPKAFIITVEFSGSSGDIQAFGVVGDSTGAHGVYSVGSTHQHNYTNDFTTEYSNGQFYISANGIFYFPGATARLVYYYGEGTLTFKTSQVQPGSGATTATFTGTGLTEVPAFYAVMLESQVNNESYRRVAYYTNEGGGASATPMGVSFFSSQIHNTTSSFSVSYNNGLYINSGGTNAGGYFHNPGTYTLYYLMASDIGGGSGSYNSLKDELDDIRNTISGIETLLAAI